MAETPFTTNTISTARQSEAWDDVVPRRSRGGRPRIVVSVDPPPCLADGRRPRPEMLVEPEHLTLDTVEMYKRPDCAHYEVCLNFAAKRAWNQFHCLSCETFEPLSEGKAASMRRALGRFAQRWMEGL